MKIFSRSMFMLFCIITFFGCTSTQRTNSEFIIVFDPMFNDASVFSEGWLIYASEIKEDMEKFYRKNPNGEYSIPYAVENEARRLMAFFYVVSKQKNSDINDNYLEDLIKINNAGFFDEYVFVCFNREGWENPINWKTDKDLKIDEWANWMKNNLNDHIPLTLVGVEKK